MLTGSQALTAPAPVTVHRPTWAVFPAATALVCEILHFQVCHRSPHHSPSYYLGKSTLLRLYIFSWKEYRCTLCANPDSRANLHHGAVPEESDPQDWRGNTSALKGILCCCKRWQLCSVQQTEEGPWIMLLSCANHWVLICFLGLLTTKVSQKYL